MNISYNALTGNEETLNEFEGNGRVEQIVRPERETLQRPTSNNDWLFRYEGELASDIRDEELAAEATVRALMVDSMTESARISYGFNLINASENDY